MRGSSGRTRLSSTNANRQDGTHGKFLWKQDVENSPSSRLSRLGVRGYIRGRLVANISLQAEAASRWPWLKPFSREESSQSGVEGAAPGRWGVQSSPLEVLRAETDETRVKCGAHLMTHRKHQGPTTQGLVYWTCAGVIARNHSHAGGRDCPCS